MKSASENEPTEHNSILLIGSREYVKARFKRELMSGQIRWTATGFAAASMGYLSYLMIRREEAAMHFPIRADGPGVFWLLTGASLCWVVLAIINWRAWLGGRQHR